jgi:hypothetical protein
MPTPKDQTAGAAAPPDLAVVAMAVLTMLVDEREQRVASQPDALATEVLLGEAGLTSTQIGALVRKAPGSVRAAQSRAKAAAKKAGA